jgi:hypothetical protein
MRVVFVLSIATIPVEIMLSSDFGFFTDHNRKE